MKLAFIVVDKMSQINKIYVIDLHSLRMHISLSDKNTLINVPWHSHWRCEIIVGFGEQDYTNEGRYLRACVNSDFRPALDYTSVIFGHQALTLLHHESFGGHDISPDSGTNRCSNLMRFNGIWKCSDSNND